MIVGIVPPHRRSDNTKWFVADATDFLIVENEKQQSDGHVVLELALSNRVEYLSDQIPSRKIIFQVFNRLDHGSVHYVQNHK